MFKNIINDDGSNSWMLSNNKSNALKCINMWVCVYVCTIRTWVNDLFLVISSCNFDVFLIDTHSFSLFIPLVNYGFRSKFNKLCKLSQVCDYCDPKDPQKAHPAEYAIDGTENWWQSPPLSRGMKYNEVNLTIDFGQVRFLIILFTH